MYMAYVKNVRAAARERFRILVFGQLIFLAPSPPYGELSGTKE